jgi:hypothetical protein
MRLLKRDRIRLAASWRNPRRAFEMPSDTEITPVPQTSWYIGFIEDQFIGLLRVLDAPCRGPWPISERGCQLTSLPKTDNFLLASATPGVPAPPALMRDRCA